MKLLEISRGAQVMQFADYIDGIEHLSPVLAPKYKKLGTELLKAGFTYIDESFALIVKNGGVYQVHFPNLMDKGKLALGRVVIEHYRYEEGMYRYFTTANIGTLSEHTAKSLMQMMYDKAELS